MQQLPHGAMLSVRLGEDEVKGLLNGELSLAAVNGPRLSVVAGPEPAIGALPGEDDGAGRPGAVPGHEPRLPFSDDGPHHRALHRLPQTVPL